MASENVRSEFESEIFELTAQEGQRRFFAHSDILTSHSEPFRALISGDWKESTERKIDLTEWDGDTVAKLISFLYTSDYPYPDPTRISTEQTVLDEEPDVNLSCESRLKPFDPDKYCFKEVLLAHARIYALAQYKDIASLRKLALYRISQTLLRVDPIKPDSQAAADTIHLLSYVYSNTDPLDSSKEPLREVFSKFAAENLPALHTRVEMAELVGQAGDFAKDLVAKLSEKLGPGATRILVEHSEKFISKILVKYAGSGSNRPLNYVRDYAGEYSNINCGVNGSIGFAWLFPEYTSDPKSACTGFEVIRLENLDLAMIKKSENISTDGNPICISPIKDQKVRKKIIGVSLLRGPDIADKAEEFDGMTADINEGRGGGSLRLAWKSVKI